MMRRINDNFERMPYQNLCKGLAEAALQAASAKPLHKFRYGIFLAFVACVMLLLFPLSTTAHAAAGNGRIYGRLLNGTKNNMPMAGETVTLQKAQGETSQDAATAKTDANGDFSFANLATDKTINYAVYMRYQGTHYVSDVVMLHSKPVQQLNLTVYEATNDFSNVAALQVTLLVHEPDVKHKVVTVSEIFFFKNLDTRTYVGSFDTSKGKPKMLRFSLPRNAGRVTLDKGFDGYQAVQIPYGFGTNAAIPPGNTQITFSFDVPYTASSYDFEYDVLYPTVQLSVMVPTSLRATSSGLDSQGLITADDHPYRLFKTTGLVGNETLHMQLEGLPLEASTSSQQAPNLSNPWLIIGMVLALLVLGTTWLVYNTTRRKARGLVQAGSPRQEEMRQDAGAARERQQALLQELLKLDKAYEAGKLSKAVYQERRAKIKARLRSLMSEQEASRK